METISLHQLVIETQSRKDEFNRWNSTDIYCPMCEAWHENNTFCQANY